MTDEEDRAWRDYSEHFRRDVLPNLLSSAVFMSLAGPDDDIDVRQATELGAAILYGKPLLVIVPRGRTIPESLRRAAAEVVDDWAAEDTDAQTRMMDAMRRLGIGPK